MMYFCLLILPVCVQCVATLRSVMAKDFEEIPKNALTTTEIGVL